ncbi:MAG: hypothetical protein A2Y17_01440 [Clostridiales bacterium GWF2_38_85]|nr:MAG: hypothetical protein A2Y17_01440 [Clostridiales bacterium GWF2_38_85]HBL85184.1 hypothetical protein [Clostridiales bacterium]
MKNYFMALVVTAVMGTVFTMLSGGVFEKYVKYIVSLICIIIILLPIQSILGVTFNVESYTYNESMPTVSNSDKWVLDVSKERIINTISNAIFQKFGIKPCSVDIEIESTEGDIVVNKVIIVLKDTDSKYKSDVKNYLSDLLSIEVEVNIKDDAVE